MPEGGGGENRHEAERTSRGARQGRRTSGSEVLRRRSRLLYAWFHRYARRYLARHFHAVRLSTRGRPPVVPDGPLVVALNHPSWWDPLFCFALIDLFPGRTHTAPIDAAALHGYRFFERLGFFGVEQGTVRGAAAFLRTSLEILAEPRTAIWLTVAGRFVDPRDRPVRIQPGAAHLAARLERGTVLPLALEYPFWDEKLPEALAYFGQAIEVPAGPRATEEWQGLLEEGLERAQDALALEARARDPEAFEVLLRGRAGIGGAYDAWRRWSARLRGETFRPGHGEAVARAREERERGEP